MKNIKVFFLPFLALSLSGFFSSCSQEETITKTDLFYGQLYDESPDINNLLSKDENNYHFAINGEGSFKTSYAKLSSLINNKENFIAIVVGSTSCRCWQEFKDNIVVPYIRKYNLMVYYISYKEFEGKNDTFGINYNESDSNVVIVNAGKVVAQKYAVEEDPFHDTKEGFESWMNERISTMPKFLYVSKKQLNNLYYGKMYESSNDLLLNFTICFSRSTCPDCFSYIKDVLTPYLESHNVLDYSYIIDCDSEGIRLTNGDLNQEQWDNFKKEYGLSYSITNSVGYNTGYVPTIYNVQCNSDGYKTGDFFNGADVYLNDVYESTEKDSVTITDSYFTEERLNQPYLSYLKESSVETKVLKGIKYNVTKNDYSSYKKAMSSYHLKIAIEFLNTFVAANLFD